MTMQYLLPLLQGLKVAGGAKAASGGMKGMQGLVNILGGTSRGGELFGGLGGDSRDDEMNGVKNYTIFSGLKY